MYAWESIQETLNYIEVHIAEEVLIENLAETAGLSVFYYQRLFTRLVKKPVREYIKLRRLARACKMLGDKRYRILDVAIEYGFGGRETFMRAFKETYGLTPGQYRIGTVELMHFDKPDLSLYYKAADEGVPLICDGMVLEYHRVSLEQSINFLGVTGYYSFVPGKMLGERTGVDDASAIWGKFYEILPEIPYKIGGRMIGVSFPGDAPAGYSSYFAGIEQAKEDSRFDNWQLPAREYVVCSLEIESSGEFAEYVGRMMKFTRLWLKHHGLTADGFFPEMYGSTQDTAYMEMWIPFKQREDNK